AEQPTVEDVRSSVAKAVQHLLSKPLLLRHRFVSDEIERVATRAGWIGDSSAAVRQRVEVVLRRTDPAVHFDLVNGLMRAVEPKLEDPLFSDGFMGRRF